MNLNLKRIAILSMLVALFAGSLFAGLSMNKESRSKELRVFNDAAALMEEGNHKKAIEKFDKVIKVEPNNSDLDAYAMYNMATILAEYGEKSSENLGLARGFAVEALRVMPNDIRIRKQVEILTEKLIDQLMKEGHSREEAEQMVDEENKQGRQEREGEGTEGGRGNSDRDY